MTCEDCTDLIPLYALGALDAVAADQVRTHIESGCAACNADLSQTRQTLDLIPLSLDPVTPPAEARAKLMARVASGSGAPPKVDPQKGASQHSLKLSPMSRGPRRWFESLLAGAIAAGITAVSFWLLIDRQQKSIAMLQSQLTDTQSTLQQIQSTAHQTEQKLEQANQKIDQANLKAQQANLKLEQTAVQLEQTNRKVQMMSSPGVQMVSLEGTDQQPRAKARVMWDEIHNEWHFDAVGLKPLAAGQTYELWLINTDNKAFPAGTFTVDANGEATIVAKSPPNSGQIAQLAVTNEPAGGMPQPTGQMQVKGKV